MTDINRNQVFLAGMVLVMLGIQFRVVDVLVLTPRVTKILAEQTKHPVAAANNTMESMIGAESKLPGKRVEMPDWLGWFFLSVGSVLILQSFTMAKPAG